MQPAGRRAAAPDASAATRESDPAGRREWLETPHIAPGGRTPQPALRAGEFDRLLDLPGLDASGEEMPPTSAPA